MATLKRALAVLLVATAVAAAVNLILTPLYHDGSSTYAVWEAINWFMAASTVVVLAVNYLRSSGLGGRDADTLDHVRVT